MATPRKAIVTLTIGEKYQKMFDIYCRKNWQEYCDKYNFDLIAISHPLDESQRSRERSPAWQKLLILSQDWSASYDQIVWIDTDILINSKQSPDISLQVPVEKLGAVETYSIPTKEIYNTSLSRTYANWKKEGVVYIDNLTPGLYYENRGIPGGDLDAVAQTGVFACCPRHHREMFEHIYNSYEDIHKSAEWNYEMPAMSYELVKNNMVYWIPAEYNFCVVGIVSSFYPFVFHQEKPSLAQRVFPKIANNIGFARPSNQDLSELQIKCLKNIYDIGYFIHFAGCAEWMPYLHGRLQ